MIPGRHLGLSAAELAGRPYSKFYNPAMAPLHDRARDALARGPVAPPLLPPLTDAPRLLDAGDRGLEDGFCLQGDGAAHVAIRTEMPGASPAMVDWWFGWHSAEPERYKLWHPRAHVHASWASPGPDNAVGRARYVGRVSHVDEYLGSDLGRFAIRFVPPEELGLDAAALADPEQATAVCARVGLATIPLDMGFLIHHVRRTEGGCEMRSRFWLGGPYAGARRGGAAAALAMRAARQVLKPTVADAYALLVHCAEEMSHLASFLPRIYAEFRGEP